MKPFHLAWGTDLHFDHAEDSARARAIERFRERSPDALVITGDTAEAETVEGHLRDIQRALGIPVYFVFGNHDYYGGSVPHVRKAAETFGDDLIYLRSHGVVTLQPGVALVGVDGWGDARNGNHRNTPVVLNDFLHIAQLRVAYLRQAHKPKLRELGAAEGDRLDALLTEAVKTHRKVIVATHVPPFGEATWHMGKPSDPDYLPYFSCKATGDVLLHHADHNPHVEFLVLCGHSHGKGKAQKGANLQILTGGARYGYPAPQPNITLAPAATPKAPQGA